MCNNCNCEQCNKERHHHETTIIQEIIKRLNVNFDCCANYDNMILVNNFAQNCWTAKELIDLVAANVNISLVQLRYNTTFDVAELFKLNVVSAENKTRFFEELNTQTNLSANVANKNEAYISEGEQYIRTFYNFISSYYNVSHTMISEIIIAQRTHTILFTDKSFTIFAERYSEQV